MEKHRKSHVVRTVTAMMLGILLGISGSISVHAEGIPGSVTVPKSSRRPVKASQIVIQNPGIAMYRLYNPNSGEHFYTSNWNEAKHTIDAGWNSEGIGWFAPEDGNDVYRLYNKNGGEHHYTADAKERDTLVSKGWKYEGVGWKSGGNYAVYREYNPNAFANNHNYTTSWDEHAKLKKLGWRDENIAWYATGTSSDRMQGIDVSQWNYTQNNNYNFDMTPYVGQFVIIRAGYGWDKNPSSVTADTFAQMDTTFRQNVEKCEKLGIPYGIYWYSYATNPDEAKLEAETFYTVTKDYNPAFGFWVDEEGDSWKKNHDSSYENADNITNMVNTFVQTMQGYGKNIGVYSSYLWFNLYISTTAPKWVAHYGNNDGNQNVDLSSDGRHFVIHQYTSNPIDKDLLYVNYTDLFK